MLEIDFSKQVRKDIKKAKKQGKNLLKVEVVVDMLAAEEPLPSKYRPHVLTGNWHGHFECHIEPDWLLIYKTDDERVHLVRLGSHSELFRK